MAIPFPPLPALPAFLHPTTLVVRVLNAVLNNEPWAQERLARYAGRSVTITVGEFRLPLSLSYAGTVQLNQAGQEQSADVQLTIPTQRLSEFPAVLNQPQLQPEDVLALVHIEGDAGLANAIAQVVSQLRFDPEAELARFTGDLIAVRAVAAMKQLFTNSKRTLLHMEGNVAEYLGEESGLLVSTDYSSLWDSRFKQLEQCLQSTEQRVAHLEGYINAKN